MIKNITVVDENENILESTYPKRAKGLVKKGRAQWISDDVIRLCVSDKKEENKMANSIYEVLDNQLTKMQEQLRDEEAADTASVRIKILETLSDFREQEQKAKTAEIINEQLTVMQAALNAEKATDENASEREVTRRKMLDIMMTVLDGGNNESHKCVNIKKQQNNYYANKEKAENEQPKPEIQ